MSRAKGSEPVEDHKLCAERSSTLAHSSFSVPLGEAKARAMNAEEREFVDRSVDPKANEDRLFLECKENSDSCC